MKIDNLGDLGTDALIEADLLIVGGGPAAYAIAHEFRGTHISVLILESGLTKQSAQYEALNHVESIGDPRSESQAAKRRQFHASDSLLWTHENQAFGVRCRVLGGSTEAWAGKSTAFDPIDYEQRDWVPNSGWPFGPEVMAPFTDRAAEILNLGPNCYDERFWELMGSTAPVPPLDRDLLSSCFWQFARSPTDRLGFLRFGREFQALDAPNLRVLINATVRCIHTDPFGTMFQALDLATVDGVSYRARGKIAVLAAGAIENARLLLASGRATGMPLGNEHDVVGRYLIDHPSTTIGRFKPQECSSIIERFGFFGLNHHGQTHMYLHGLTLSPELQRREKLLNCAAYMMEDRAPDDPWSALKRLLRLKSEHPLADMVAAVAGSGLLAKGIGARMLASDALPGFVKEPVLDALIRHFPNSVVREYRDRGLPHKLAGIDLDAITEQGPDSESRLTLADATDPLGVPLARVDWKIDDETRATLIRLGWILAREFPRIGLPAPTLEPWVRDERPEDGPIIDMAHTAGTTRMAADPRFGVVNEDCAVHGVANLYVAGASVFPTGGHANLTLMIVAMSLKLADHLKGRLA